MSSVVDVKLIRGDGGVTITLYVTEIDERITREPKSLGVPYAETPIRIIFDDGTMTKYFILTGTISEATPELAFDKKDEIDTAVETWFNLINYGSLPTLRIQYSSEDTEDYTIAFSKVQYKLNPSNPSNYSYELECLQGSEENV